MQPSTSVRNPGSSTCFSRWCSRTCRSSGLAQLALAEDHEPHVGHLLDDQARRLDEVALPLVRNQRRNVADDRRAVRQEERFVDVDRRRGDATCSTSIPSCTVTVRSAGTPSATSIWRIASEAAMKQSTCRYFQRESELPLRWKSTRRDATSAGTRTPFVAWSGPSTTPSAAIATPCGSWAWMMSGVSRLISRESLQAAARSISVRGAIGMSSSPSAARRRSSPSGCADQRRAMPDGAQAVDGQQHLVLSAAPRPGGVDVEGEHQVQCECSRKP